MPESVSKPSDRGVEVITPEKLRKAVSDHLRVRENHLGPYEPAPPRANLLWIAVDLDGTLAEGVWTPDNPTTDIGAPRWDNVAKLEEAVAAGYKVMIHTSRPDTDYENIEGWLDHWQIPWKVIRTGKPLAALYIDDRGRYSEDASWLPQRKDKDHEA